MSLLTLAIRFSDKTISSFKIHKKADFFNFININFIHNEEKLKKYISMEKYPQNITASNITEHNNYDSGKAFIAPFDYGMTLIDFFNKRIYNYNEYSGFFDNFIWSIKPLIGNVFKFNQFDIDSFKPDLSLIKDSDYDNLEIKSLDYRNNKVDVINPFKQNSINYNGIYNLYQAIKNKDTIYFYYMDDYNNRDYLTYNNSFSINETLKNIIDKDENLIIGIEPLEWKIYQGGVNNINKMYSYVKDNFLLNNAEENAWEEYIKKQKGS